MSAASEELARDNCAVSDEVVQLREDKASQAQNLDALQVIVLDATCNAVTAMAHLINRIWPLIPRWPKD